MHRVSRVAYVVLFRSIDRSFVRLFVCSLYRSQPIPALPLPEGEISPQDPRLDPAYYAYYYSQRPLDPRLPPPLLSWHQWPHYAYLQQNGNANRTCAGIHSRVPVSFENVLHTCAQLHHRRRRSPSDTSQLALSCTAANMSEEELAAAGAAAAAAAAAAVAAAAASAGRIDDPDAPKSHHSPIPELNGEDFGRAADYVALVSKENGGAPVSSAFPGSDEWRAEVEQQFDELQLKPKGLVDKIQEDFPRTPSPIFSQAAAAFARAQQGQLQQQQQAQQAAQQPQLQQPQPQAHHMLDTTMPNLRAGQQFPQLSPMYYPEADLPSAMANLSISEQADVRRFEQEQHRRMAQSFGVDDYDARSTMDLHTVRSSLSLSYCSLLTSFLFSISASTRGCCGCRNQR